MKDRPKFDVEYIQVAEKIIVPKKWIVPLTDLDPNDFAGINLLPKDLSKLDEKPTPNAYLKPNKNPPPLPDK